MITRNYLYKKEIDWSVLHEGLTLPLNVVKLLEAITGTHLAPGESQDITILFEGGSYNVALHSLNLDKKHNRKNGMFQIRYTKRSGFPAALQKAFARSYQEIGRIRDSRESSDRSIVLMPEGEKDYVIISSTDEENVYLFEALYAKEIEDYKESLSGSNEQIVEAQMDYVLKDPNSTMVTVIEPVKIRKLNKRIGDTLKRLYDYKCQLCGEQIGEPYGVKVVEAHHIEPYVDSLNNDSDNILIVCPNHHRLIHAANPKYDKENKQLIYPNGLVQPIKLDKHL